jgi:hypothetical protein
MPSMRDDVPVGLASGNPVHGERVAMDERVAPADPRASRRRDALRLGEVRETQLEPS